MECYPSDAEVWKPIPGYEGIYEASSQGRIRTAEGKTTYTERHGVRSWQQRILKQKWRNRKSSGKADARVCLWKDGEEKTFLVARLVAMSFLPAPYDKLTVNHIDGDPANNNISNLEWVTVSENNRLGFQTGLFKAVQKAVILTDPNGYDHCFASMADASRYLERNEHYVSEAIARCTPCRDINGNKYWARLAEERDDAS